MQKKIPFLLCLLLFTSSMLFSKELNINIIDKDLQTPLEGVKVYSSQNGKNYFSDAKGKVKISFDDSVDKTVLILSLIGYETKKINIKDFTTALNVELNIENTMESKELVIEEKYYKNKEEVGKSLVVDKEELKTLAMRGTVEDVISSIKTMPGISYSGNFMTDLSIRGSNSSEVAASYDGFIVRDPFYWGSGASMFNPNIVESVKLNNGYFPVKFGFATSGLLDVNIKDPDEGFKIDTKFAYSTAETHVQTPLGAKNMGLLFGGRVTYLDVTIGPVWRAMGLDVSSVPYIYEGNIKWLWKVNDRVELFANGFIGADGAGFGNNIETSNEIKTYSKFENKKIHSIGFGGIKVMPADFIHINWLGGYEFLNNRYTQDDTDTGKLNGYNIDLNPNYYGESTLHSGQTRLDLEFELTKKIIIGFGGDFIYDFTNRKYNYNFVDPSTGFMTNQRGNYGNANIFNSAGYLNFNFYPIPDLLEIEIGLRISHYISRMNNYILNTDPAFNPRFNISITPIRNKTGLESFTISLSTGLYSHMPQVDYNIEKPIPSFGITQEQVLTNVLGFDFNFPYELNLKVESYFKYYFNKYYAKSFVDSFNESYLNYHSDGYGYAAGFDIILKRKISRYIDGWISYSFIFTKYYFPKSDGNENKATENGEPTGEWFYPSYHRWHSMNLVLNIKPLSWLTISPTFGISSGLPRKNFSDSVKYQALLNGSPVSLYKRDVESYDDLRTSVSIPFSIKVSLNWYFPRSKVGMEAYVAMDNLFSLFWYPDGYARETVDKYTGDIVPGSKQSYEVFLPSFGLRISY